MKVFKKILIIAGEASGDLHAAKLVRDVHKLDPTIHFFGMGGKGLQEAGADILVNSDDLAFIGIFDVLINLPKIFFAMQKLRKALLQEKPDLVILVDYPGFNLRFAKIASEADCRVLYYISPKLWASRERRITAIKKYVDHMAVIFPFEVEFYRKYHVPVSYVGNPLTETLHTTMVCAEARNSFKVVAGDKVVGLFPGSRKAEIKRMLPVILRAAAEIKRQFPDVKFLLPIAPSLLREFIQPYIDKAKVEVHLVDSCLNDLMQISDVAIAVSGTITLQLALMHIPMVIIYKIFPSFISFKWVIKIPDIGLCNIVVCRRIVKELWQRQVNVKEITAEIVHILQDDSYREQMITDLKQVAANLSPKHKQDLARLIISLLT